MPQRNPILNTQHLVPSDNGFLLPAVSIATSVADKHLGFRDSYVKVSTMYKNQATTDTSRETNTRQRPSQILTSNSIVL